MITKAIDIFKEIRLFISFVFSLGLTSALNFELFMEYVWTYNIHLFLSSMMFFYLHHKFSNNRHKKSEEVQKELQEQIKDLLVEAHKTKIREEIRLLYKELKDEKEIKLERNIKYIYALEKIRIELKINGYTDEMMRTLIEKIKLI